MEWKLCGDSLCNVVLLTLTIIAYASAYFKHHSFVLYLSILSSFFAIPQKKINNNLNNASKLA